MVFEKKHPDWMYDQFKTNSGIWIQDIRYGIEVGRRAAIVKLEDGRAYRFDLYEKRDYHHDWIEVRKHHDNISWKNEPIINQFISLTLNGGIIDINLAQNICIYMRDLD